MILLSHHIHGLKEENLIYISQNNMKLLIKNQMKMIHKMKLNTHIIIKVSLYLNFTGLMMKSNIYILEIQYGLTIFNQVPY